MYIQVNAYIKEYSVPVGISIMLVNTIKSLWELDIAHPLSYQWIHHETHWLSKSLTIIDVVITIQVQQIRCICQHSRDSDLLDNRLHSSHTLGTFFFFFLPECRNWEKASLQSLTKAFIAPAFLWWLNPGLFSLETYTKRGNSFPSVSCPPLWPRKTY